MKLLEFLKDHDDHARCKFTCVISVDFRVVMSTEGSTMQRRQFQKDRDAQARCRFKFFSIQYTSCGRMRLLTAIRFVAILHTSSNRNTLITAIQLFAILHTFGCRRLILAKLIFTIADVVETEVYKFQKRCRHGADASPSS